MTTDKIVVSGFVRDRLTVLDAVGDHPTGERCRTGTRLRLGRTVNHDARQGQDFGDPAAVDFLFNLNRQHRQRRCRDYGTSSRMCEQKRSGAARWLRKQPTALTLSPDQWHRPSVEGDDGIAAEPCAMRRDDAMRAALRSGLAPGATSSRAPPCPPG